MFELCKEEEKKDVSVPGCLGNSREQVMGEEGWKRHRHIDLSGLTPALLAFPCWTLQVLNDPCRSEFLTRNLTFESKSHYSDGATPGVPKRQWKGTEENGVHRVQLSSRGVVEHTQVIWHGLAGCPHGERPLF